MSARTPDYSRRSRIECSIERASELRGRRAAGVEGRGTIGEARRNGRPQLQWFALRIRKDERGRLVQHEAAGDACGPANGTVVMVGMAGRTGLVQRWGQ